MSELEPTVEIPGVDAAGPEDGDPIVFVHGVMFTRKLWTPQRAALADEFRVVVPDLPGHGVRADEPFRMAPALALLEDVVDAYADGSATVVGLSLGGYVATEFARRRPDRVDSLVVSGSSANPVGALEYLTKGVSALARSATESDRIERGVQWAAEKWVDRRDLPPEIRREIAAEGIFPEQFGEAGFEIAGHDFREAFAAYPGPALVLNGKWDLINRFGEGDHADVARNAYVEVLEEAGHVCNLERPEEYAAAVRRAVQAGQ